MSEPHAPQQGRSGTAELNFTRVFDAPRQLVFECMTQPEHLTHFWGPRGVSAPLDRIRVDLRPGGIFETVMVNDIDGSEYGTRAVFEDVREPELLVWTELHSGMRVTARFTDIGGNRTEVHIVQANVPRSLLTPEAEAGFLTSLDRFATYLVWLQSGPGPC
jgi:uncharacterized protein YndB with AHSA1/START domain